MLDQALLPTISIIARLVPRKNQWLADNNSATFCHRLMITSIGDSFLGHYPVFLPGKGAAGKKTMRLSIGHRGEEQAPVPFQRDGRVIFPLTLFPLSGCNRTKGDPQLPACRWLYISFSRVWSTSRLPLLLTELTSACPEMAFWPDFPESRHARLPRRYGK